MKLFVLTNRSGEATFPFLFTKREAMLKVVKGLVDARVKCGDIDEADVANIYDAIANGDSDDIQEEFLNLEIPGETIEIFDNVEVDQY